jgi:phosphatidylserine decarboxylase
MKQKTNKVIVFNYENQCLEQEQVYKSNVMDFLHHNVFGILLNEIVISSRWFSKIYGLIQKTSYSRQKIHKFVKKYNISQSNFLKPIESYSSFNEFFIRKISAKSRPIDSNSCHLISPADARLIAYPISKNTVIPVKGKPFSIDSLLNHKISWREYENGLCLVFRLAPIDYHRFCYIDSGFQSETFKTRGKLYSVNPMSLHSMIDVFTQNVRESCQLHTINFGTVAHIDVGALVVGKIYQHKPLGGQIKRGEEKGYFEFGGSTIILLFKSNSVLVDPLIMEYSKTGVETLIKMGQKIGQKVV